VLAQLSLAVTVFAQGASAQGAGGTGDAAAAEELFRQAKALLGRNAYEQACPKLAESHRLDPAGGTVLTLALCYRAQGKLASAWASFQEALARAKQDRRPDRERVATREIAAIEPVLSRLRVRVEPAAAALPGFRLLRDGLPLGPASYNVASPVDPGEHEVVASAEGHKPFRAALTVGASADERDVLVPALEPEPNKMVAPAPVVPPPSAPPAAKAPPIAPPHVSPEGPSWGRRAVGYGGIGLGSALLGAALYYGYRVKLDRDEARDRCPSNPCSDAEGVRRNEAANDHATVANVSAAIGLVALGVGITVVLWPVAAPAGPRGAPPRAALALGPGLGGAPPRAAPGLGGAPPRATLALAPGLGGASLVGSFE
jgi:hypothetical protein